MDEGERANGGGVKCATPGYEGWREAAAFTKSFDGEAVACGRDVLRSFDRLRYRRGDGTVFLFAFDLLELNGDDLRPEPREVRKATLASVLGQGRRGPAAE